MEPRVDGLRKPCVSGAPAALCALPGGFGPGMRMAANLARRWRRSRRGFRGCDCAPGPLRRVRPRGPRTDRPGGVPGVGAQERPGSGSRVAERPGPRLACRSCAHRGRCSRRGRVRRAPLALTPVRHRAAACSRVALFAGAVLYLAGCRLTRGSPCRPGGNVSRAAARREAVAGRRLNRGSPCRPGGNVSKAGSPA